MKANAMLISILILLLGCKKTELSMLPEPTQSGANTFGCLIDGRAYVATGKRSLEGGYQSSYDYTDQRHNVWIITPNMDVYVRNVYKKGEYLLQFDTNVTPTILFPESYGYYYIGKSNYITTSQYKGKVTITNADTVNSIISGNFEFVGYDAQANKTVHITDGRFDIKTH